MIIGKWGRGLVRKGMGKGELVRRAKGGEGKGKGNY